MPKMIHRKATTDVIVMTLIEVFYRRPRSATISRVTEQAGASETSFYGEFQSKEALIRAFLEDRNAIWLRWFQSEIDARFETTRGGLEIIADVLRTWFQDSRLQSKEVNKHSFSECQVNGEAFESFGNPKDQLRRFVEHLARKMGLRYPDVAASTTVQIVERTIMATLMSGDLSELKTAQLLFQCLQRALSVGFN